MYIQNKCSSGAGKARRNLEKHSVSFQEAVGVFDDPRALDSEDLLHSIGEVRRLRLGKSPEVAAHRQPAPRVILAFASRARVLTDAHSNFDDPLARDY